jgi:hypothetical protein
MRPNIRRRFRKPRRAPGQAGDVSREELALVQQLVVALERIERAAGLYPPGSPAIQALVDELHAKAQAALARTKVVELHVGADVIEYEGHVVYDGSKGERSLAFTLEDGGVRRLVLLEGLERAEVDGIVAALHESRGKDAEDLVTLLWQRDLKHVSFVAVNVYADAAGEAAIESLDAGKAAEALVDRLKGRRISVDVVAAVKAGAARAAGDAGGADEEAPEVFRLGAGEQAEVRRWISDQAEESPAPLLASVLLALLSVPGADDAARRRELGGLEGTLATLLDEGDIFTAAEVLVGVRRLAEPGAGGAGGATGRAHAAGNPFKAFLAAAASKENGKRIARHLSRARDEEALRAARLFVVACGRHAFSLAGELLGGGPHDAAVISALAQACGGDVAEVRERVTDGNPRLAAAAVRILAEAAGDGALEDYRRALQHRDAAVRREAVFALSRCKDPRASEPLVAAFDDAAPEVRAVALRAFPPVLPAPRPELYERVKRRVEDEKAFDERPAEEQPRVLAALARLDPEKGTALLEGLARATSLLHRERTHRRRLLAIAALGEVATTRAEAILSSLADGAKQDDVRAACRAALDRAQLLRRSPRAQGPGHAEAPGEEAVFGSRKWLRKDVEGGAGRPSGGSGGPAAPGGGRAPEPGGGGRR